MNMASATIQLARKSIERELPESVSLAALDQLLSDIEKDYYTIVTVGEFKHGKSTIVNALLGEKFMPVDVTPTTALVHALFYGEKSEIHIMRAGQDAEIHPLQSLQDYRVGGEKADDSIDFIKIFLPSPLLKERVVLVDTPGLNDLNTHRSEVTEKFIPNADAVIFALDLRAPVSKTEFEFLETMEERHGIQSIIFAANFVDTLQEEEVEDTLHYIKRRLSKLGIRDAHSVIPISAKLGMEAKQQNDTRLLNYSGIPELEARIKNLLEGSQRKMSKQQRNQYKFERVCEVSSNEAEELVFLMDATTEELTLQMESISSWLNSSNEWGLELESYIEDRRQEIDAIVLKSLQYFSAKLEKQLTTRIVLFTGVEIDHFINTELPLAIQNGFENWIDQYSVHLKELLMKLEVEISKGLSHAFDVEVQMKTKYYKEITLQETPHLNDLKYGNSNLKAGILVGGTTVITFMLGATIIAPIMGMVALPFVQKVIQTEKLKKVKPELQKILEASIAEVTAEVGTKLCEFIRDNVSIIQKSSQDEFEASLNKRARLIEKQVSEKKDEQIEVAKDKLPLTLLIKKLKEISENGLYK